MADFESDQRVCSKARKNVAEEAFNDSQAVRTAVESERRIAFDLGTEGFDLFGGDVRKIGNDEIEGAGDFFEEIAPNELGGDAETRGVETSEVESVFTDVSEDDFAGWPGFGEAKANTAGASGHVEHTCRWCGELFEDEFDERFGFRPRNERTMVAHEFVAAKFNGAEEMLQRFAFAATTKKFSQSGKIGLGDSFVETQVDVETTAAENVREKMLHVEPGFLDFAFLQVGGAGLEDFEELFHAERNVLNRQTWQSARPRQ